MPRFSCLILVLFLLILSIVGCQGISDKGDSETPISEPSKSETSITQAQSGGEYLPFAQEQVSGIRQWATSAKASSEWSDSEWSATQATGASDTNACGDYQTAWASAESDSEEWIELTYSIPVYVTEVGIIQSFNPDQVVKVELIDPNGDGITVYRTKPISVDQNCPYMLKIQIERPSFKTNKIRITVDQNVLGLGWNEIDAVELIGEVN